MVVVVQSLSRVQLFSWTAACQASLSFTIFQSLLKFMSIEFVMLSNHLILCCLLLLLPSIFPSIFHFPLCISQGIKVPFENKVRDLAHRSLVYPCHSFFPFSSFSLSVLSGWLLGTQELYWLSVLTKEDQASFSSLYSFSFILLLFDPGLSGFNPL